MENQEVYKLSKGTSQVTIVHKKGLDDKAPVPVSISGNIDSVHNWLKQRIISFENSVISTLPAHPFVVDLESHVIINREELEIKLIFNESNPYTKGCVIGTLDEHTDFKKWHINTSEDWDHEQLAEFIKMNRSSFNDNATAMKLVTELKGLKVKVEKEIEKSNDNRGSFRAVLAQQVVASNIPDKLSLCVPVFKGHSKVEFQVELYVNPTTFRVKLISPDVSDIVSSVRDTIIDQQKKAIEEIAPKLVIIEQ